jgi:pimeloyl-ACP methyl ester carboxylesterase
VTTAGKPAVLLLHGAIGAGATMAPLAGRLAPHFTVHVLDFAGHGPMPAPAAPLTMELLAEQVAAYITEHALAPARIFGHSLGGYVALQLAEARPELVARVATLATKIAWTPEVSARMGRGFDTAAIRAKAPKVAEALAALHTGMGWEALLAATSAMLDDLGARPRLTAETFARIAQPVRIAVGDRDVMVSIEESLEAMRALPKGELEVLPATPHPMERVDLDRLTRSLVQFLGAAA